MDKEVNWADFIGFIIAFIAMVIVFLRRKARKQDPEAYVQEEQEQTQTLEEYLRSIGEFEDEKPQPPQIPAKPKPRPSPMPPPQKDALKPTLSPIQLREAEAYVISHEILPSRGIEFLLHLSSPQDLVIARELFDKPLALRDLDKQE